MSKVSILTQHKRLISYMALFFCVLLSVWVSVNRYVYSTLMADTRENVVLTLVSYTKSLAANIQSSIRILEGLQSFAELDVPFESHFDSFAHGFVTPVTAITNVSLAPNGIQTYVYPLQGNETVIGRNLFQDERAHVVWTFKR